MQRIPLVLIGGKVAQLPPGDTLNASANEVDTVQASNANAGPLVIGTPVYVEGAGSVDQAQANAIGTAEVLGLIRDASVASGNSGSVQTNGTLPATTGQWDAITGQTGGLTVGAIYYLDAAAPGKLTTTAPTAVGEFVTRVGVAISTTELSIYPQPSIQL